MESKDQEFAEFYAACRDDCLRIVLVSVGDRQRAEDLVAEAFSRAWMAWPKISRHPAPQAWVVRTALNAHISWWRRSRREVALGDHDLPAVDTEVPAVDTEPAVDDALVMAVRRLPSRQRQVITLRVFFDLDVATTAGLLGIAPGTVCVHLHRALASLRSHLPVTIEQEISQ